MNLQGDGQQESGEGSIESWGDDPACTLDPQTGFAINKQSLDTLRWYSYLRRGEEGALGLLQSKNDE